MHNGEIWVFESKKKAQLLGDDTCRRGQGMRTLAGVKWNEETEAAEARSEEQSASGGICQKICLYPSTPIRTYLFAEQCLFSTDTVWRIDWHEPERGSKLLMASSRRYQRTAGRAPRCSSEARSTVRHIDVRHSADGDFVGLTPC